MQKFQTVTALVALAGEAKNTVAVGVDVPVTYPETLVLMKIHGKTSVHTVVATGFVERDVDDEASRLAQKYGRVVHELFPPVAGMPSIPAMDSSLPTVEEQAEVQEATKKAQKAVAAKRKSKTKAAVDNPTLPGLGDLPE